MSEQEFSTLQLVKRRFFAMRNGIIADTMRKAGSPYRIIFGLNLPQLKEIAEEFATAREELFDILWRNESTRESRMTAVLLIASAHPKLDVVASMVSELNNGETEAADLIASRLIRGREFVTELLDKYRDSERVIERYLALRIAYLLVEDDNTRPIALQIARAEIARGDTATLSLARQLEYDADW